MGVENWFNCSGKRSDRSTYSQSIIFCTNLAGKLGLPGMEIVEGDSEVDAVVIGAGVPREVAGCVIGRRGLGVVENDGRPRAARNGEDKDVPRERGPPVDDNALVVVIASTTCRL